ncbi:hypothetical protein FPSE5266_03953 [Fusarium pseudograminearum]|nr:hypothetical protein FPSE5266_03953 [Fusarium pseudograminearum]
MGSRAPGHREKTFAIADGLFASLVYIDTTEPKTTYQSVGGHGSRNDLSRELQALYDDQAHTRVTADAQHCSMNSNSCAYEITWSSIRAVCNGMDSLWVHFVNVAADLENVAVNNILARYQDAKGLRYTGAIALRNVLSGPIPNDLGQVFAFCCFSYVVSHLLHARNILPQGDILAGVHLWLHALEKDDERGAFQLLVQWLWPEAQHHLRLMYSVPAYQSKATNISHVNSRPMDMSPTNGQNLAYSQQDIDLFIDLLNTSNADLVSPSPSGMDMSSSQPSPYVEPHGPSYSTTSCQLRQAPVFKAVIQYIQENACVLGSLGGWGLVLKDVPTCLAWDQERRAQKRQIQDSFIRLLSSEKGKHDLVSRSIVNIAEAFVERGLLQEPNEIEFYMQLAGIVRKTKIAKVVLG